MNHLHDKYINLNNLFYFLNNLHSLSNSRKFVNLQNQSMNIPLECNPISKEDFINEFITCDKTFYSQLNVLLEHVVNAYNI